MRWKLINVFYFTLRKKNNYICLKEDLVIQKLRRKLPKKALDFINQNNIDSYGVIGHKNGPMNKRKWNMVEEGDLIIIYIDGIYRYLARVLNKNYSQNFKECLPKSTVENWDLIYFIYNLQEIYITKQDFSNIFGYKQNFIPQGMNMVKKDSIHRIKKLYKNVEDALISSKSQRIKLERIEKFREKLIIEKYKRSNGYKDLISKLKEKNKYSCQICGYNPKELYGVDTLKTYFLNNKVNYSSISEEELIVLCPNHYKLILQVETNYNRNSEKLFYPNGYTEYKKKFGRDVQENNIRGSTNYLKLILSKILEQVEIQPNHKNTYFSQKFTWHCEKGHEWKSTVTERIRKFDCPFCNRQKLNSLQLVAPELLKEWNYEKNSDLNPKKITYGSSKKVWWKCIKGHEWVASIQNRTKNRGCPVCSGKQVSKKNSLITTYPKIAKQWHYEKNQDVSLNNVSYGSHKKVWWKCDKGHEWQAMVYSRTNGTGCPFCIKESF